MHSDKEFIAGYNVVGLQQEASSPGHMPPAKTTETTTPKATPAAPTTQSSTTSTPTTATPTTTGALEGTFTTPSYPNWDWINKTKTEVTSERLVEATPAYAPRRVESSGYDSGPLLSDKLIRTTEPTAGNQPDYTAVNWMR